MKARKATAADDLSTGILLEGDLYAGWTHLELPEESFDLGDGVILSKTYSYVFGTFMMAFSKGQPGEYKPAPWRAVHAGSSYTITTQLHVTVTPERELDEALELARTVLMLVRLMVDPGVLFPVFAMAPLASIREGANAAVPICGYELDRPLFPLRMVKPNEDTLPLFAWVILGWPAAHRLKKDSAAFRLACDALASGQYIQTPTLTLVSLWGALEGLFLRSTSELTFRLSSLVAVFLTRPGPERLVLRDKIKKLYGHRSAAAHGKPKAETEALLSTFELVRAVLIKIIDRGAVPTDEELDVALLGAEPWLSESDPPRWKIFV